MPLPKPLPEIKKELQTLLGSDESAAVIQSLENLLPEGSEKKRQAILLEGRLNQTNKERQRGIASSEQLNLAYNQVRSALYDLVESLEEKDFDPATAGASGQPAVAAVPKFVIIYAEEDTENSKMLNKHLNVLKIMKKIQVYNVQDAFGDRVAQAKQEVENADYLLVLVTVNLFNAPDWFELVYTAMGEGRRIIPIRISRTDFEGTGLEKLRSLPSMNRAVSDFKNNPDDAYVDIVTELRKLLPK